MKLADAYNISNPVLPDDLSELSGTEYFSGLLSTGLSIGIMVGGIIFLFMLVSGGISWLSAGGDKVRLESARSRITQAIIGLVLLFSVIAIITLIEWIFGVSILNISIENLIVGGSGVGNIAE